MRKVYEGETLSQALLKIKIDLGKDAIIVEHKKIKKGGILGFFGKTIYQVVAIKPGDKQQSSKQTQPEPAKKNSVKPAPQQKQNSTATAYSSTLNQQEMESKNKLLDIISQNTGKPKPGELNMIVDDDAVPDFNDNNKPKQYSKTAAAAALNQVYLPQQNLKTNNPYVQNKGKFATKPAGSAAAGTQHQGKINSTASPSSISSGSDYNVQLNSEIQQLKNEIKNLSMNMAKIIEHSDLKSSETIKYPGKLSEIYMRLIENEVDEPIAEKLISSIKKELKTEDELDNINLVEKLLEKQIISIFQKTEQLDFNRINKPVIMTLVGPTGVGKTTTIAKLGANFSLIYGRKVGFLTIDTYRLAAVEQLEKYAEILEAPVRVIFKPEDFDKSINELNDCEIILVDTAGRSPNDQAQMSELKKFVENFNANFEIFLVIQATTKYSDIEEIIDKFSNIKFDKVIITKIDETITFGSIVNIAHKYNLKINYVTTGQDVPDDIEYFDAAKLAAAILKPGSK